jgi:hypothetical protein
MGQRQRVAATPTGIRGWRQWGFVEFVSSHGDPGRRQMRVNPSARQGGGMTIPGLKYAPVHPGRIPPACLLKLIRMVRRPASATVLAVGAALFRTVTLESPATLCERPPRVRPPSTPCWSPSWRSDFRGRPISKRAQFNMRVGLSSRSGSAPGTRVTSEIHESVTFTRSNTWWELERRGLLDPDG